MKHLPLKLVAEGRIETADGWSISLNWFDTKAAEHPYSAAHAFAPVIVRAVNSHAEMLAMLKECADFVQPFNGACDLLDRIEAVISKAESQP